MELHGRSIIGGEPSRRGRACFSALAPASGQTLSPPFYQVTDEEIDRAMALAAQAFEVYRAQPPDQVAAFLDRVAEQIVSLGQELIERASLETALPEARLIGERARTVNQLKMFAELVREATTSRPASARRRVRSRRCVLSARSTVRPRALRWQSTI